MGFSESLGAVDASDVRQLHHVSPVARTIFNEGNAVEVEAIVWTALETVEVSEYECAEPGSGQVQVEVAYSLISPGTEKMWLQSTESHYVLGTTFPFVPGYSAAGRIAKLGPGVEGWTVGDRVVANPVIGCHASWMVAPVETICAVPENVSFHEAVFFALGHTAVHSVRHTGAGLCDSMTIVGQGPIGYMATQIARTAGVHPILALDLLPDRREAALEAGATYTADPRNEEEFEAILHQLGGGTSTAIDLSGSATGLDTAIRATSTRGTIVMSSGVEERYLTFDYLTALLKGHVLKGGFVGAHRDQAPAMISEWLRLVAAGIVTPPVSKAEAFPPSAAPDVYRRVIDGDRSLTAPAFVWNAGI